MSEEVDLSELLVETIPSMTEDEPQPQPKMQFDDEPQPEVRRKGLLSRFRKSDRQKERKPTPAMPRGGLAAPVAALYTKIGQYVQLFDPGCGGALVMGAADCGKAWEEVAKRNPAVRRWLLALLSASSNMELLVAHLPILAAVAIHHIPAVRDTVQKMTSDMSAMFAQTVKDMEANANAV